MTPLLRVSALATLLLPALGGFARASFGVSVSYNDSAGTYSSYYSEITATVQAAGALWSSQIAGTSGTLRIQVNFDSEVTASAASASSYYVGTNNEVDVYEQGALAHILNGYTPTGSVYDAVLNIGTSYLANELYFDPNPAARTGTVPTSRTDAESVFLHEMTHMLVFNGFLNETTGAVPAGNYESTFDSQIKFDGSNFYFTGAKAEALYGGAVPLTYGNIFHVGNYAPRPGSDLVGDLMSGVAFYRGQKYGLSALDLAMAADAGVPLLNAATVPEPASLVLVATGLIGAVGVRTRRKCG